MNPVYAKSYQDDERLIMKGEKAVFDGILFTAEKISPRARLELGTAGSAGQRLIYYRKANQGSTNTKCYENEK